MLDMIVRNEMEPDIVQISGGEPTMHPQFFEILDAAKRRPIKHLMVNTNGCVLRRTRLCRAACDVYAAFRAVSAVRFACAGSAHAASRCGPAQRAAAGARELNELGIRQRWW